MACGNDCDHKFKYTSEDLTLVLQASDDITSESGKDADQTNSIHKGPGTMMPLSCFDMLLTSLWENAMTNSRFRYKLLKNSLPFKVLPGKYNYISQLNPDRAQNRRRPQDIQSVNQPFNTNEFHFNKIDPKEILMRVKPPWDPSELDTEGHPIIINVSPLEYCNILLTPFREQCRPQKLTKEGLRLALELCLVSNSCNFRLGFNSLCGFASVNHEHYHAYYLSHRLFIEHAPLIKVPGTHSDSNLFQFEDTAYPPGFVVVLTDLSESAFDDVLNPMMKLSSYFERNNVGHNLYITRGSTKNIQGHFDSVRIFVWARKSSFGAKACDAFNPALCELAGHFPIKSESAYETVTEEYILKELHEICDEPFKSLQEWIIFESI